MLNRRAFNEIEFNGLGFRVIALGSVVGCGSSTSSGTVGKLNSLATGVSCGSSTSTATAVRLGSMKSSRPAGAAAVNTILATRSMRSSVLALASGRLGSSQPRLLGGSVVAGASGYLIPATKFLASSKGVGAAANLPNLIKTQMLATSTAAGTSGNVTRPIKRGNAFAAAALVGPSATCTYDWTVGGVKRRGLFGNVYAGATYVATIDPKKNLRTSVTGGGGTTSAALRRTRMLGGFSFALANSDVPYMVGGTTLRANAAVGAVGDVAVLRTGNVTGSSVIATATVVAPRLSRAIYIVASAVAGAPINAANFIRYRGLLGSSIAGASSSAAPPRIAPKIYATGTAGAIVTSAAMVKYRQQNITAAASATASAVAATTRRGNFLATVRATATGIAEVDSNLFALEPDYRTVFVEEENFTYSIDAENFTITVSDDESAMQTFQKQPTDVLGYDIDLTAWLTPISDQVNTASASIVSGSTGSPNDLIITQTLLIGSPTYVVKVWLAKGLDGTTYEISLNVQTVGGRTKQVDFKMKIKET